MKRYFYLIALIGICSCGKTEPAENPEPEQKQEQEITSTNYTFVDIEYSVDENSDVEYTDNTRSLAIYENGTSTEQTYIFHPENNLYEKSGFGSYDMRAFKFIPEGQMIKVPVAISDDGVLTLDDGTQWEYLNGQQQIMRPVAPDSGTKISIPPHHRLTMEMIFIQQVLSADYKLHLKGVEFGETLTVEGWWWGVFYVGCSLDYTVEPI